MTPHTATTREDWERHPRFPAQALLLGSHDNFRLVQDRLEAIAQTPDGGPAAERLFRRWMYAMRSHEAYEERKLYPYLSRRWGASMRHLEEGHEELGRLKQDIYDAFEARTPSRTVSAIEAFGAALRAHLDVEEQTVIPLLLELEPGEFFDYYHLPIDVLLERLDGASDEA